MFDYMFGKITELYSNSVTLDVNSIGYSINVANPYFYEIGKTYKIYLYHYVREDESTFYGFRNNEERGLFLKLIGVKGVGPKMALPMFAMGSTDGICDAIDRENVLYLKKFPKIGEKVARQIILDLKGKVTPVGALVSNSYDELIEVLNGLGYKEKDYKNILGKVDNTWDLEQQIKEALKLLLK